MARLMLSPYNVLALDEPTNHMDILSKDRLKQALKCFDGTLIVVSHDRDFLEGLVDKLYEFRDGRVKEHLGGVAEFLERRKLESLHELEVKQKEAVNDAPVKDNAAAESFKRQKALSKEDRKIRNRISFLEKEIALKEGRMQIIEKILANPGNNEDIYELTREYLELKLGLDSQTDEWTTLMEQIDN